MNMELALVILLAHPKLTSGRGKKCPLTLREPQLSKLSCFSKGFRVGLGCLELTLFPLIFLFYYLPFKDFGMCGIRVGVLYTRNHEIRKAVNELAVFHGCPGPVQYVLSQFLRDRG